MPGPWEKYQTAEAAPAAAGPWTKYQPSAEEMRPKTAIGESVIRGAAQGASLGFADEATAAIGTAKDYISGKLGLRGDFDLKEAPTVYDSYLKKIRGKDDAAKADNPKAYTGGAIAGGVATALTPGIAAKALGEGSKLGAIAAKTSEGMNTIKGAAGLGGATGAGLSEANPFKSPDELTQFGKDVGTGALTGAVFQGAATLGGKAMTALKPENLKKAANVKTLKAAGYMGKDLKNMSEAEKQAAGEALDRLGVVRFGDSVEDVASKAGAARETAGKEIGAALDSVDDLVKNAKQMIDEGKLGGNLPPEGKEALKAAVDKQFQFNMGRIGQRIQKELIEPNASNPLLKGEMSKLGTIADDFAKGKPVSMREGNIIKGTQGKVTNFNSDTVPQAFKKELYDIIKTEIDDIVAKTGNLESAVAKGRGDALGNIDVAGRNKAISTAFDGSKKDYGILRRTQDIADERAGQIQANREISLTDTIAGAAGLASGNPINAIALGGLNKLARQYGDSAMAAGFRKTAEVIERAPAVLGPFAKVLEDAAKKGAPSLMATHLKLMRDPDFARIMAEYENERNPINRRVRRLSE
jgi:hypothetical protein